MKLFISWSGTNSKSHAVAKALHDWLPNVFQMVETFMSSDTLVAGERWRDGLSDSLEQCDFGIACLTPKSLNSSWVLFECGALAKKVDRSRVVPVLHEVGEQMLSNHPLTMFNYVHLEEAGIKKLVQSINSSLPNPLPRDRLESAFAAWWPKFSSKHLDEINSTNDDTPPASEFNLEASIEEILTLLRSLSRARSEIHYFQGDDVSDKGMVNALLKYRLQSTPNLIDAARVILSRNALAESHANTAGSPQSGETSPPDKNEPLDPRDGK